MPFERILKNFPYGIESCDGLMFRLDWGKNYIYKDGKWTSMKSYYSGFDVNGPIVDVLYVEENCEYTLLDLNEKMNQLIAKETEMLTSKMMIFNASNEEYLPELSLMIAGMCFELGVM